MKLFSILLICILNLAPFSKCFDNSRMDKYQLLHSESTFLHNKIPNEFNRDSIPMRVSDQPTNNKRNLESLNKEMDTFVRPRSTRNFWDQWSIPWFSHRSKHHPSHTRSFILIRGRKASFVPVRG